MCPLRRRRDRRLYIAPATYWPQPIQGRLIAPTPPTGQPWMGRRGGDRVAGQSGALPWRLAGADRAEGRHSAGACEQAAYKVPATGAAGGRRPRPRPSTSAQGARVASGASPARRAEKTAGMPSWQGSPGAMRRTVSGQCSACLAMPARGRRTCPAAALRLPKPAGPSLER